MPQRGLSSCRGAGRIRFRRSFAAIFAVLVGLFGNTVCRTVALAQGAQGAWRVTNEIDPGNPISGKVIPVARATHYSADGRQIEINATCPNRGTIVLSFIASTKDQSREAFAYVKSEDDEEPYLEVIYRMDSGHPLIALVPYSKTNHANVAGVFFSEVQSDFKPIDQDKDTGEAEAAMFRRMYGGSVNTQDITAFLAARFVRFQLPFADGLKEIVPMSPQDPSFQNFVSLCGIDVRQLRQTQTNADEQRKSGRWATLGKYNLSGGETLGSTYWVSQRWGKQYSLQNGGGFDGYSEMSYDRDRNLYVTLADDETLTIIRVHKDSDGLDDWYYVQTSCTLYGKPLPANATGCGPAWIVASDLIAQRANGQMCVIGVENCVRAD